MCKLDDLVKVYKITSRNVEDAVERRHGPSEVLTTGEYQVEIALANDEKVVARRKLITFLQQN